MPKLIANGMVIVALSLAAVSQAAAVQVHARHHRHILPRSSDIIVRTPPIYYPPGFVSNGVDFGGGGANGLSGDDSYPPPRGFHGGLYSYGVYAMGPGGPYDKVEGCLPGFSC